MDSSLMFTRKPNTYSERGYEMMNGPKAKTTNLMPRIFVHEFKRICGDPEISAACLLVSLLGLGSNTSQVVALHMQIYEPSFLDEDINAIVNIHSKISDTHALSPQGMLELLCSSLTHTGM
ncbi:hypothetical protein EDC04DRAFT_2607105 [Pisolithus marmoratus]|nr:hypothetical protein EDC04DRAFT_2607105 [Pisolithus marmoratus]